MRISDWSSDVCSSDLLAYSPLAQGYLTGKYQNGARTAGARSTLFDRGQRYEKPGVADAIDNYLALARAFDLDPAQLALAFVTSRTFVTPSIIGATKDQESVGVVKGGAVGVELVGER